ncbi:MAG: ATP-binding cassette domain-containing protein, partial [Clostridia bacterium]|nr:ATP-binding cassette domain-containing protein [Clostridia bacterium]
RSAFASLPPSIGEAARTLGHGPFACWAGFLLPAAWPGVRAGLVLAWVRAFGEFGATAVLAYHPYSLPVLTWVEFGSRGLAAAAPLVGLSLAVSLAFVLAGEALARRTAAPRRTSPLGGPARPRSRRVRPLGERRAPGTRPPAPAGEPWLALALRAHLAGFELDLELRARSRRLALLGPSGAGKTLTLRMVAGLLRPERGFVRLEGEDLTRVPAERRGIAFVPQDAGLFPTRTVWGQLLAAPGADPEEAASWLEVLGLAAHAGRRPGELSAGERQRAALGRALVARPRLLLLDEPLSALDMPFREDLRRLLARVQREAGLATVVVTHDPRDALLLADEIGLLHAGRLFAFGRTEELFRRPGSGLAARLLGFKNVLKASRLDPVTVDVDGWRLPLRPGTAGPARAAGELALHIPPGALELVPADRPGEVLARASPSRLVGEAEVRRVVVTPDGWEAEVALVPGPTVTLEGAGEAGRVRALLGRRALAVLDASRLLVLGPWQPARPGA